MEILKARCKEPDQAGLAYIGMSQRSVSMLHEVHLLKVPAFSFLDVKRQVVSEEEVGSHNKLVSA